MLNIVLCDDDPFILRLGAEKMERIIEQKGCRAQVATTVQTGGELVTFATNNSGARPVFPHLDFGEGRPNGIDIAKRIRREDASVKVDRISADGIGAAGLFMQHLQDMLMRTDRAISEKILQGEKGIVEASGYTDTAQVCVRHETDAHDRSKSIGIGSKDKGMSGGNLRAFKGTFYPRSYFPAGRPCAAD